MPILQPNSLEYISRSAEQTRRVGMRLGAHLRPGDLICLNGELGSGKTTLVQGIAAGWGSLDAVSSPTFVLVNVYRRPGEQNFFHLDAYRLGSALEAEDLDLDSLLEAGPMVVEWAERIQAALPPENLEIRLNYVNQDQRDLLVIARGPRNIALLGSFQRQVYGAR